MERHKKHMHANHENIKHIVQYISTRPVRLTKSAQRKQYETKHL